MSTPESIELETLRAERAELMARLEAAERDRNQWREVADALTERLHRERVERLLARDRTCHGVG